MSKKTKEPQGGESATSTVTLTLAIVVPVGDRSDVDFGPLVAAVEVAVAEQFPDAQIKDVPPAEPLPEIEDIPPGHSARPVVLTNEQWAAVDRQAKRGNISGSDWLRRFLTPYLRRG